MGKKKKGAKKSKVVSVRKHKITEKKTRLKKLQKKYVSVTEENLLITELSRLNRMIITFGFLSAVALLVIIFLVFFVFRVGEPLALKCEPYVTHQVYQKTLACDTAMSSLVEDHTQLISAFEQMNGQLSSSCQQEVFSTGIYAELIK